MMLFAGWEVRIVKNCDQGLEHFHARGHSFPPYRPILSRQITCLFFSCRKLVLQPITNGFVYTTLSSNWLAHRLLTICKKSSQRTSNSDTRQGKIDVLKKQIFFDLLYVSCIYVTC